MSGISRTPRISNLSTSPPKIEEKSFMNIISGSLWDAVGFNLITRTNLQNTHYDKTTSSVVSLNAHSNSSLIELTRYNNNDLPSYGTFDKRTKRDEFIINKYYKDFCDNFLDKINDKGELNDNEEGPCYSSSKLTLQSELYMKLNEIKNYCSFREKDKGTYFFKIMQKIIMKLNENEKYKRADLNNFIKIIKNFP